MQWKAIIPEGMLHQSWAPEIIAGRLDRDSSGGTCRPVVKYEDCVHATMGV